MNRFLLALAVTLFALWVRLPVLRQGLWEDEATAVYVAESPTMHEFVRRQAASDYSPPLFNAVLAGYGRLFGFGEVPVKALAIAMSALACGAIALAAAEGFGPVAGILSGLFAAENRLLIDMSAEVRPYSLSGALAALSFWAIFRFRRRLAAATSKRSDIAWMSFLFCLTAYSHYAGTVAIGTIGVFALALSVRRKNRPHWLPVALAATVAGLLFVPWLPVVWSQLRVGFPWAGPMRPSSRRSIFLFKALTLLPSMPANASTWTLLGLALIAAAALASSKLVRGAWTEKASMSFLLVAVIAAAFFAVGLRAPPPRYITVPVSVSMILMGGFIATVFDASRRSGVWEGRAAIAAVILVGASAVSRAAGERAGAMAAARAGVPKTIMRGFFRDGTLRPGDLVIGAPDMIGPTLWYYAPPGTVVRGFVHWSEPALEEFGDYTRLWPDPAVVDRCLSALDRDIRQYTIQRVALVWAVGGDGVLPFKTRIDQLRAGIAQRFPLVSKKDYKGPGEHIQIDLFAVR